MTDASTPLNLPEYASNPFIACLPPLQSRMQMTQMLIKRPIFNEIERTYPAYYRKHCVLRLARCFEPLDRHVQFAERFDMLLRQGYLDRNPETGDYMQRLQNSYERKRRFEAGLPPLEIFESFASTFALLGASGNGKSRTVGWVLRRYQQLQEHTTPYRLTQIVWMRLDCPSQGSQAQLCRNFFYEVDRLLGTDHLAKFGGKSRAVDAMLNDMSHIANLHAIGVLVIDEIQFLRNSKTDREALLSFFVTLVNVIGIPLVLVGTNSALPILQSNFKEARRANGLGSMMWDPIPNAANWRHLIKSLWQYQWLTTTTPLTDEIIDVLHEETQGIMDILIKLLMLVQMRIISVREAKPGAETITIPLIRQVAKEDFRMVRPMLDALRQRDMKLLQRYDDLLPFQSHFDQIVHQLTQSHSVVDYVPPTPIPVIQDQDDVSQQLATALKAANIADDMIDLMIKEALARHPSGDFMLLMGDIIRELQATKVIKPKTPKQAKTPVEALPDDDLRVIAAKGTGDDIYTRLFNAGVIRDPLQELAA